MITKVYGPPGTGKTTWLLEKLEEEKEHTSLENIAFVTWSTSACEEVLDRLGFKSRRDHFRTLHGAILSSILRDGDDEMKEKIDKTHKKYDFVLGWQIEFCKKNGIPFNPHAVWSDDLGNIAFNLATYALSFYPKLKDKAKCLDKISRINSQAHLIAWMWEAFKKKNKIIDHNDYMIYAYDNEVTIPCDILFVDEAQDLSLLEFEVLQRTVDQCERVYFAGDDDQAIYTFKGANAQFFLDLKADEEIVLSRTYRLPKTILDYSQKLIDRVVLRKHKEIQTDKNGGIIQKKTFAWIKDVAKYAVDVAKRNPKATVFLLFRTNYMVEEAERGIFNPLEIRPYPFKKLKGESIWDEFLAIWNAVAKTRKNMPLTLREMKAILKITGYFTKEEKETILETIKKTGSPPIGYYQIKKYLSYEIEMSRSLTKEQKFALRYATEPFDNVNLYIDTIHASKGREADIVILCDAQTKKYSTNPYDSFESEVRTFYVGVTRAKWVLVIAHILNKHNFLGELGGL